MRILARDFASLYVDFVPGCSLQFPLIASLTSLVKLLGPLPSAQIGSSTGSCLQRDVAGCSRYMRTQRTRR